MWWRCNTDPATQYFRGYTSQRVFYNRALSAGEVQSLYTYPWLDYQPPSTRPPFGQAAAAGTNVWLLRA